MPGHSDDFKKLEEAHRRFITAYTLFCEKGVQARAVEARKALLDIKNISGDLRKSIQDAR